MALNGDGTLKYTLDSDADINGYVKGSQPAFDISGNIYIPTYDGWIYSIEGHGNGGTSVPFSVAASQECSGNIITVNVNAFDTAESEWRSALTEEVSGSVIRIVSIGK